MVQAGAQRPSGPQGADIQCANLYTNFQCERVARHAAKIQCTDQFGLIGAKAL